MRAERGVIGRERVEAICSFRSFHNAEVSSIRAALKAIITANPAATWPEMDAKWEKELLSLPPANRRRERLDQFRASKSLFEELQTSAIVQEEQDRTSQQDKLLKIIHDERLTTKGIASQLFPEQKRAATPEADERRNKRPHAGKKPVVVNAEEAEDVDTLVAFETEVELPVEEGNSAKSSTSNRGSSGHEKLLSLAILRERFGNIKQFESTKDLIFEGINVSAWIRQAQSHLLSECEKGRKLKWKVEEIADILYVLVRLGSIVGYFSNSPLSLLNNIVLFSRTYLPSFLAQARKPAVAKLWNKATATFAEERVSMALPSSLADAVLALCIVSHLD
ncbi:hypothetical protein HDU90_006450 [Geranomyces variabilis]|nr:hypothetical protein HDU90_006450 [Geranomyces variabilis]